MIDWDRRDILASLAVGSTTIAGCSALKSEPSGVAIDHIIFTNRRSEGVEVHYRIDRNEQTVLDQNVTVESEPSEQWPSGYTSRVRRTHKTLHERAVYTIQYRLDNEDEWSPAYTFDGESNTCLSVFIEIHDGGGTSILTGDLHPSRCSALTLTPE
jgi:lambda repressor-like predicted transcriptional regulator